ncbi:MAG: hypothetical protein PHR16_05450 [Methylovulum sp.]|nr:hypothetical protein [Methylovulum sp.]
MIAIEFEAQTHNGIVEIPKQYQAWQNKTVRVILLDPVEEKTPKAKMGFSAVALNTKGYHFDREQANER